MGIDIKDGLTACKVGCMKLNARSVSYDYEIHEVEETILWDHCHCSYALWN